MDPLIGIVCGRCEAYATLGTLECASCHNSLVMERPPVSVRPPGQAREASKAELASTVFAPTSPEPSPLPSPARSRQPSVTSEANAPPSVRDPRVERDVPAPAAVVPAAAAQATIPDRHANPMATTIDQMPGERRSPSIPPKSSKSSKSTEELMDQAKNFVCRSCSTPVPMGHKFCGRCGAAVPPEILAARTQFFGSLQAPGKAKLILIRGEGVEGLSYQLNAEQHIVGRSGQLVFPDDPFVSPKHANFFYRNGKLVIRDEGSLNGVYLRLRGSVDVSPGDSFLAGEQVFKIDATPKMNDQPGPDGTFFYSSPKHSSPFRIGQMLQGGNHGMTVCARGNSLQIGREGGDLNFPSDLYMSASHCKLEDQSGKLVLTDLNSRNGTYVRLKAERELAHGDYLFIGRKLLRVEITAA